MLFFDRGSFIRFLVLFSFISNLSISADECMSGKCDNGQGTKFFSNGDKYSGSFKNGLFNGRGILTYGSAGKGEESVGQKVYVYATKYSGYFKDGKMHGEGTLYFDNGNEYEGQFEEDYFQG